MTKTLVATYEAGTLKLDEPLELADRTRVEIPIEIPSSNQNPTDRWQKAQSFIGFIDEAPREEPLAQDHDRYLYDK